MFQAIGSEEPFAASHCLPTAATCPGPRNSIVELHARSNIQARDSGIMRLFATRHLTLCNHYETDRAAFVDHNDNSNDHAG